MKFKVVLEPSEEGGFTVFVPSLPGCISQGETEEEAFEIFAKPSSFIWSLRRTMPYLARRAALWSLLCDEGPEPLLP